MTVAKLALAATLALALPCAALAAPPTWVVDKPNSKLTFSSSFSGEAFTGTFRRWDAQIVFDPKQLAASKVTATIEPSSASTGDETRDQSLPTADWFDTGKFPRATFSTTSFKSLGGNRYEAAGTLTVKGISKPVTLPFSLAITGSDAKMNGQVTLSRAAFGVGKGQFESAETVPLNVVINVALTAHKAP